MSLCGVVGGIGAKMTWKASACKWRPLKDLVFSGMITERAKIRAGIKFTYNTKLVVSLFPIMATFGTGKSRCSTSLATP